MLMNFSRIHKYKIFNFIYILTFDQLWYTQDSYYQRSPLRWYPLLIDAWNLWLHCSLRNHYTTRIYEKRRPNWFGQNYTSQGKIWYRKAIISQNKKKPSVFDAPQDIPYCRGDIPCYYADRFDVQYPPVENDATFVTTR